MSESSGGGNTPPAPVHALTGLRFFAAVHVVVFHLLLRMDVALPAVVLRWADFGPAAVGLFFVLSGFILTYNYLPIAGKITKQRFWRARVARILPVYWLALLVALPVFAMQSNTAGLLFKVRLGLVSTLIQSWFPRQAYSWNAPAWSLSVEIFFYAMFPLILLVVRRVRPVTFLGGALCLWAVAAVAHLGTVWSGAVGNGDAAALLQDPRVIRNYVFPLLRLPEFLLGVGGAYLFIHYGRAPDHIAGRAVILSGGLLLLIMIAPLPIAPVALFIGALAPLFLVFIWSLAHGVGVIARIMAWPSTVVLGQASYAIYLLHIPIWMWWDYAGLPAHGGIMLLTFVALTISISIGVFYVVEEPMRRRLRPRRTPASDDPLVVPGTRVELLRLPRQDGELGPGPQAD